MIKNEPFEVYTAAKRAQWYRSRICNSAVDLLRKARRPDGLSGADLSTMLMQHPQGLYGLLRNDDRLIHGHAIVDGKETPMWKLKETK